MTRGSYCVAAACICFTSFARIEDHIGCCDADERLRRASSIKIVTTPLHSPGLQYRSFDRSDGSQKTIMISIGSMGIGHRHNPPVSRVSWFDQDPMVAPDGNFLLFNSDRPASAPNRWCKAILPADAGPSSNIWRAEQKGDHWGAPVLAWPHHQ